MASVINLGLHQPIGLSYLIQEQLLPIDPSSDSYTWNTTNTEDDLESAEDEILTTPTCVVWSHGGVVRKSYRFEIESEPVTRAILTYFSSTTNEPVLTRSGDTSDSGFRRRDPALHGRTKARNSKHKALVVFLRAQAHIYYLSGSSHVIHLPFEVEHVTAAPYGLLIQRKPNDQNLTSKLPKTGPASLIGIQPQAWSAASSVNSTFSTAALGSPKQLLLPDIGLLGNSWRTPDVKDDSSWPRLFTLTDPLAEMGLVVTDSRSNGNRRVSMKSFSLNPKEELLHITDLKEFTSIQPDMSDPLILAVTMNRETNNYTIWRAQYVEQDSPTKRRAESKNAAATRRRSRRSSFNLGAGNDSSTPLSTSQYAFRESMGSLISKRADDRHIEQPLSFESVLDPDYEAKTMPRRSSRRLSSYLARTDLSSAHERSAFSELATTHQTRMKRKDSISSQHTRVSLGHAHAKGYNNSQFTASLNGFLEAPVDELLDELRAGGDFEGFHNMGLDDEDFEGLKKELVFHKIESVPIYQTSLRFSTQHKGVSEQRRVFTLTAPTCASEDPRKSEIVVCILDKKEKQLVVVSLNTKLRSVDTTSLVQKSIKYPITITQGTIRRAKSVLDACKLEDGYISRMLVLTESSNAFGDLTLQAPWSQLMKIELRPGFASTKIRGLDTAKLVHEKHALDHGARAFVGLHSPSRRGHFDVLDDVGHLHRVQVLLQPRNMLVKQVINVCRFVLPGERGGESILTSWWNVCQWLREHERIITIEEEWNAVVIVLFSAVLAIAGQHNGEIAHTPRRSIRKHITTINRTKASPNNWAMMIASETGGSGMSQSWQTTNAWKWLPKDNIAISSPHPANSTPRERFDDASSDGHGGLRGLVKLSRDYLSSEHDSTPNTRSSDSAWIALTTRNQTVESRMNAMTDVLTGLHLLREDFRLHVATADIVSSSDLVAILAQLYTWVGWNTWAKLYNLQDAARDLSELDPAIILPLVEPVHPPDVYQWIESCFVAKRRGNFSTIPEIVLGRSGIDSSSISYVGQWSALTPRITLFSQFFTRILPDSSHFDIIEALQQAGLTTNIMETLPEAVLMPLKESIGVCQAQPSASWNTELLSLIGREDVHLMLLPEPRLNNFSGLAPTHLAGSDFASICHTTSEVETIGSFDGSAEIDRQSITSLIFKEDRRFNEAASILNTLKQVVARVEQHAGWTDSDLLDAQKDHVLMLAKRTLAIPTGRGLLYFSARIPLLTERFPVHGFNLQCTMKPQNTVVSADRTHLTEEKVSWAFFHAGVSAGLSISKNAKGIDTSWILYNKPAELSNRHAGFLLALGLNGHLRHLAKWEAFKYLTPKHTMTSIGLLLGLAASYLGTMDSLVTRLLSVHVTRMLPPGAAELNLSPLTQTAGIMSIGLLYCRTQHRRVSEVLLSEVEHIHNDLEEEPYRNEGYRLAAGFALGCINLGKGSDLKGLHDMHITERLLKVATGSRKVDLVHVLDKATAGAILAITLIFMKSEDMSVARKIDIPQSVVQYDYVRPDMLLLRTLAHHLIMWNEIVPTAFWIESKLPTHYRHQSDLKSIQKLSSEDLPFFNIMAGLLFSIGLRFAGSGSVEVRDLLLAHLDQMLRISRLRGGNFDETLTERTVRNCLDLIALSTAAVMAGTGDLPTFRRLRALHGRDDPETPYGSHLAAHMAIGALFLGGGTHTFGTSDLAIASLIISFYPLSPTSILDNEAHLQAFRHLWVLATEPRCLVVRDIDTNRPVSIPLSITLKTGVINNLHTPCLLPELDTINTLTTHSDEYWNIMLDFGTDERVHTVFKSDQTIFIRRKQAIDSHISPFQTTLQALQRTSFLSSTYQPTIAQPLDWLFNLEAFVDITEAERALVLGPSDGVASVMLGMETTVVDVRLMLEKASLMEGKRDRLMGLKLLFAWRDALRVGGEEVGWIRGSVIDGLKASVWMMSGGRA